jgi:glutamate/tyrosine decarboxylase-like PLP-dependent enzyme
VTDGHKWLQVPYDCGFAIVRDRTTHQRAMTQWSSYLPTIGAGDRVPSALVPELSRRARGVPVYALLKTLGRQGWPSWWSAIAHWRGSSRSCWPASRGCAC